MQGRKMMRTRGMGKKGGGAAAPSRTRVEGRGAMHYETQVQR
jgi:hypothetical protein